jgi:hypothetical protein
VQEGSVDKSESYNGPQRGSEGWNGPQGERDDSVGESEGWDGRQREQDEPMGGSTGDSIDQFCSSCNQKKPLIDFGRFLTCNPCRQRNQKANQARHLKQKALLNNKSSSS